MTRLETEDIKKVGELPYNWDNLTNKTILISGGTGFIGTFLCNVVRYRNKKYNQHIKVISISLHKLEDDDTVTYYKINVCEKIILNEKIDYIIHMASNTHPEQYKNDPVGTITKNIYGTYNLLMLAKDKQLTRFVLLSSCEIYGEGSNNPINELYCGYINCNTARAGYNESKRVSESLCQSFYQQYSIESVVVRLARVFGADRTKEDSKAMAQFINNAINSNDIILKSKGLQKYSYVYIADAVSGVLKVLLDGAPGEAYNVSAEYDNMNLGDYAEYIAKLSSNKVRYIIENNPNVSQSQNCILDISKIKSIGYEPLYSVCDGIARTYQILKANLK